MFDVGSRDENLTGGIIDHYRAVEPRDEGLSSVERLDPFTPFAAVDPLRGLTRLSEVDATGRSAVR